MNFKMAASLSRGTVKSVPRLLIRSLFSDNALRNAALPARCLSASAHHFKSSSPQVCLSHDEKMIMCWHPEPDFPYEYTQDLPRDKAEMSEGTSMLKVNYLLEEKLKNRMDGPTDNELTQLFYTSKDYFRTRHRTEKQEKKRFIPKDRDGL